MGIPSEDARPASPQRLRVDNLIRNSNSSSNPRHSAQCTVASSQVNNDVVSIARTLDYALLCWTELYFQVTESALRDCTRVPGYAESYSNALLAFVGLLSISLWSMWCERERSQWPRLVVSNCQQISLTNKLEPEPETTGVTGQGQVSAKCGRHHGNKPGINLE